MHSTPLTSSIVPSTSVDTHLNPVTDTDGLLVFDKDSAIEATNRLVGLGYSRVSELFVTRYGVLGYIELGHMGTLAGQVHIPEVLVRLIDSMFQNGPELRSGLFKDAFVQIPEKPQDILETETRARPERGDILPFQSYYPAYCMDVVEIEPNMLEQVSELVSILKSRLLAIDRVIGRCTSQAPEEVLAAARMLSRKSGARPEATYPQIEEH